eukprot:GHVO01006157.1.p1 GENE.GHVO01006157.1~~GHVO01006157.1.p1  ORF type:complete len:146 (-),score=15.51 GHVO01006157.1:98-535(-)
MPQDATNTHRVLGWMSEVLKARAIKEAAPNSEKEIRKTPPAVDPKPPTAAEVAKFVLQRAFKVSNRVWKQQDDERLVTAFIHRPEDWQYISGKTGKIGYINKRRMVSLFGSDYNSAISPYSNPSPSPPPHTPVSLLDTLKTLSRT